jgi:hypothetical protein
MFRSSFLAGCFVLLLARTPAHAADLPLQTAAGVVVKANANVVLVRPRLPDGQLGKAVALKVRGTSQAYTLTLEKRGGQLVPVQRAVEPQSLTPTRAVAVIFTVANGEEVLLSAVVLP